jgi:hypothetical protein
MLKTIIPQLVSFDTELNHINGFYLAENFDFYTGTDAPLLFNYKIVLTDKIDIPKKYDYRNGYHLKHEHTWNYQRNLKFLKLKFQYDTQTKTFYFNKAYARIPFELGGITSVGRLIADIVNLELYLSGYVIFRGCAVKVKNRTKCLIGMGYNGKTTYVKDMIKEGGKYISEDFVLFDMENSNIYPISPYYKKNHFARKANQQLSQYINDKNTITKPLKPADIFLIQNSTNKKYKTQKKNLYNYLLLCGWNFLSNTFVRSMIIEDDLHASLDQVTDTVKNFVSEYKFINLKNYNFDQLNEYE